MSVPTEGCQNAGRQAPTIRVKGADTRAELTFGGGCNSLLNFPGKTGNKAGRGQDRGGLSRCIFSQALTTQGVQLDVVRARVVRESEIETSEEK